MRDPFERGYTVSTEVTPKKGDGDFIAGAVVCFVILMIIGLLAG
jgi:hypothetical protein